MAKGRKRSRNDDSPSFIPLLTPTTKKVTWTEFQHLICWVVGQGSNFDPPLPVRLKSTNPPKTVVIVIIPYLNYSDLIAYLYGAPFIKKLITNQSIFQMYKDFIKVSTERIRHSFLAVEYCKQPPQDEENKPLNKGSKNSYLAKNRISESMLSKEEMEQNSYPQIGKDFSSDDYKKEDSTETRERLKRALEHDFLPIKTRVNLTSCGSTKRKPTKNIFSPQFLNDYHSMLDLLKDDPDFHNLLGVDCEMCITKNGSELTRISIVNVYLEVVFDCLVTPSDDIIDYCTKYSGINSECMEGVDVKLDDVLDHLDCLINSNTILLGHSLENDFLACKIKHSRVIDTSVLYQNSGQTFKYSLSSLAWKYFKIDMNRDNGHDSVDDARVAMALAVNWIVKGRFDDELLTANICTLFSDNSIILKSSKTANPPKESHEVYTKLFDSKLNDMEELGNEKLAVPQEIFENCSDNEIAEKFTHYMKEVKGQKTKVGICLLRDTQRQALRSIKLGEDRILQEIPCSNIAKSVKNTSEIIEVIAKSVDPGSYLFLTSCSGDATRSKILSTLYYSINQGGEESLAQLLENLQGLSTQLGVESLNIEIEQLKQQAEKLGESQIIRESQLAKTNFKAAWGVAAIKL